MNVPSDLSRTKVAGALFGVAVGDALGVPVEFRDRSFLDKSPVTGMQGQGTWNQPAGTWSDDSSLTFCLAEALCAGSIDPDILGTFFLRWYREGWWTAQGRAFDIGGTTREALLRIEAGMSATHSGPSDERSNGNGALMRILPLAFYMESMVNEVERWKATCLIGGITHGHIRSHLACHIYLEMARLILSGRSILEAYVSICRSIPAFCAVAGIPEGEYGHFTRILQGNLMDVDRSDIRGGGYVVHCLEAALWCLLKTNSFPDAVLMAVNLGEDTDTTAAVCGGLAGLAYGAGAIPGQWMDVLAKAPQIMDLCKRLQERRGSSLLTGS